MQRLYQNQASNENDSYQGFSVNAAGRAACTHIERI
jgi:hypothetical protein